MFALRRVAARALYTQPTRQISTRLPSSFTSRIEACRPSIYRSFHQSRQLLAEEERGQTVGAAEPATVEPSAEEQKEIKEESVAIETDGQQPVKNIAKEATQQVKNAAGAATDALSSAAQTVTQTVSRATTDARFPPNTGAAHGQPTKILYIGNLFFEVTAAQLEAEFKRFGEVVNSRIVTDPKGLSKGFGYIELADQSAADRAVEGLNQTVFQGRRMAVQYHIPRDRRPTNQPRFQERGERRVNAPSKTLFIGNMSYQMSDRDLNDLFREVKNVLDVRVAIDRRSGQPRGFAHADFIDVASAEKAKEYLSQKEVYGRQLRVDFSAGHSGSGSSE